MTKNKTAAVAVGIIAITTPTLFHFPLWLCFLTGYIGGLVASWYWKQDYE
jgi:hypothetical protein